VKEEEHVQNIVAVRTRKNQTLGRYANPPAAGLSASARLCLNAARLGAGCWRRMRRGTLCARRSRRSSSRRRSRLSSGGRRRRSSSERSCRCSSVRAAPFRLVPVLFASAPVLACDHWCGVCAEMKQERTKLLEQEKLRIASKRRYAAQQFLIQQEEQRDELERSAMNKVSRKRTSCNSPNACGKSR